MFGRALIVAIIIVSLSIVGVIGYAIGTTDEPPAALMETSSKTFRLKELEGKLQQVNDEIATNQEEILKVMDEINRLNNSIFYYMSRMQQEQSKVTRTPIPGFPGAYSTSDDYFVRLEQQNITSCKAKIAEQRLFLKQLQTKQLKLEEERNQLLIELAKLGK